MTAIQWNHRYPLFSSLLYTRLWGIYCISCGDSHSNISPLDNFLWVLCMQATHLLWKPINTSWWIDLYFFFFTNWECSLNHICWKMKGLLTGYFHDNTWMSKSASYLYIFNCHNFMMPCEIFGVSEHNSATNIYIFSLPRLHSNYIK